MKQAIRQWAKDFGFSACGFTDTRPFTAEQTLFEEWIQSGKHATMTYMENHFDKRMNPALLVEGSRSIISLIHPYFPAQLQAENLPLIAKYAYGEDYHTVIKEKLHKLVSLIDESFGPVSGRVFTDSAPILERPLAVRAGLGWIGKNSLHLTKQGSFHFLAEIFLDIEIEPDEPFSHNYCGNCRACIESCPTNAIVADGVIDSNRCISYWTIENKGEIDVEIALKNSRFIYGCDICQDVCPWNRSPAMTTEPRFSPHSDLLTNTVQNWQELSEESYRRIFKNSAVKRAKFSGLRRNIDAIFSRT